MIDKKINLLVFLKNLSLIRKIFITLFLITVVGIIDYITGYEFSFSLFYLLPVVFVTWTIGVIEGTVTSILSAIIWFLVDTLSGKTYSYPLIPFWNAMIRFGFFIIVTLLLSEVIKLLKNQEQLNRIDQKTGAINSTFFYDLLKREIDRNQRYKHSFALIYFDLDNFKMVNDQYGHLMGDRILCQVVKCTKNTLRKVDIIARLGGDEFALLLPETNGESAQFVLSELRNNLLQEMKECDLPITFSFGGIIYDDNSSLTVEELVSISDELMYDVKSSGKNGIKWKENQS